MWKKSNLFRRATGDGGKRNELYVPNTMNPPKIDIKIWGEDDAPVKNFHDLSAVLKSNRALITLSFDSGEGKYKSDNLDEVVYRVVNPNPSSKEEWEKMENESLTDFLINKSDGLLDEPKEEGTDLICILKKEGDKKINLLVEKRDGTDRKLITNVELESEFYHKEVFKTKEIVPITPLPKTSWWKTTQGKVIILGIVGIIFLLIIIFHKKIWSWIKQDGKKSPEVITL